MNCHTPSFGAITRIIFKNPPQTDWDKVRREKKEFEAHEKRRKGWDQFNQKVQDHLNQLAKQNENVPGYYAAALPVSWFGHLLVVDGPDFDQIAKDLLLERQRFLNAFEKRVTEPGGPGAILSDEETAKTPLPKAYNWGLANNTAYEMRNEEKCAEIIVKKRYWERATQTIDVTIDSGETP